MRNTFLYVAWMLVVLVHSGFAQDQRCPEYPNKAALLHYLQDHRTSSLDADSTCVNRAFASLSHDPSYTDSLVQLLGFERNDKNDDTLRFRSSQYPAIGALARLDAVPYLIRAIKDSGDELIRTNAAEAIDGAYGSRCEDAVSLLKRESNRPEITAEQKDRLRNARKYVAEHQAGRPCKSLPSDR